MKMTHYLFLFLTVAVDKLPNFLACPTPDDKPGPHHQCSIHLNCESVELLETAYKEAMNGRPSARYLHTPSEHFNTFFLHPHIRFNNIQQQNARDTSQAAYTAP